MTPVIHCASQFWREAMAATIRESGHPARNEAEACAILRAAGFTPAQIAEHYAQTLRQQFDQRAQTARKVTVMLRRVA